MLIPASSSPLDKNLGRLEQIQADVSRLEPIRADSSRFDFIRAEISKSHSFEWTRRFGLIQFCFNRLDSSRPADAGRFMPLRLETQTSRLDWLRTCCETSRIASCRFVLIRATQAESSPLRLSPSDSLLQVFLLEGRGSVGIVGWPEIRVQRAQSKKDSEAL